MEPTTPSKPALLCLDIETNRHFPNPDSCLCLVSALPAELDDE